MADIEQEGFFRLIFDDADVKRKQIELEKRTRQNKIAQKELNDEIKNVKQGTPEYEKLIEKSVKLKTEQKLNAKEQAEFNRELKNTAQAGQSMKDLTKDVSNFKIKASDSYNEAIAKNNLLRQALKNTKGAFGENSKEVDKLKAALKSNNEKLKEFDATTGVHVRNVGNYEDAISTVLNRLGPFGTIINNIKNDYSTLNNIIVNNATATKASATATEASTAVMKVNNNVTSVATTEKGALTVAEQGWAKAQYNSVTATKASVKSLNLLKIALIGTGIGAIVVALGALVSAFLSTQRGADALNKVMRPLGAIFDRVIGLVQDLSFFLVDKLKAAFNDPVKALKDLGNAILENVINRFKAVSVLGNAIVKVFTGEWKQGVKELHDGFIQLGFGVTNATDKITEGVKSVGLSIAEANRIGKEIDKITKSIELQEIELAKRAEKLKLISKQQNDIAEDTARSGREQAEAAQKAIDAQRELERLEIGLLNDRVKLVTLENQLNDTGNAAKLAQAELEAEIFTKQTAIQEAVTTLRNKRNIALKRQADEEIGIERGLLEEIKTIGAEKLDVEQANIDVIGLAKESARQSEAEANDIFREQELEKEEEYQNNLTNIKNQYLNDIKSNALNFIEEVFSGRSKARVNDLEEEKRKLEEEVNENRYAGEQLIGIQNKILSIEKSIDEEKSKNRKEALKLFLKDTIKAVEAFLITQVAKATAGSLAQADSIATFGATGVARAAILTGLISAAGAGLRGLVDKFEDGGIAGSGDSVKIGGKDHSQGGTKFYGSDGSRFEAQKGEILTVVKRNDSNTLRALSQENVRRGGVDFFKGKRNNSFYQNGGVQVPLRNKNKIIKLDTDTLKAVVSIEQLQTETNKFNTFQDASNI